MHGRPRGRSSHPLETVALEELPSELDSGSSAPVSMSNSKEEILAAAVAAGWDPETLAGYTKAELLELWEA